MGAEERGGHVQPEGPAASGDGDSTILSSKGADNGLTHPGDGDLEEQPPGSPLLEKGPLPVDVSYSDIAKQFSLLGWTAFGGPSAHIGLFEKRLVEKLNWMTTQIYAEIFALCQCMPGPTSTQVSFAIGTLKKGVAGGLLSGILFQYPGALIMTAVGLFAYNQLEHPKGALNGLVAGVSAVGVALVASAAKSMAYKLCAGPKLAAISTATVVISYYWPKAYTFPCLIIAGGLITLFWGLYKKEPLPPLKAEDEWVRSHGFSMPVGGMLLVLWLATLIISLVLVNVLNDPPRPLRWWETFYRIGSIIFGGGQVVLPMIYNSVVQRTCTGNGNCVDKPDSWVTSKQFYAGLGIVQALPGPLFNFSTYLGTIIALNAGYVFVLGSVLAWCGLFFPGILIIFGIMPFWGRFRRWSIYRRALPGLNAAGVGLIIVSVFTLTFGVLEQTTFPEATLCLGVLGFTAVDQLHWFEPLVVGLGGGLGVAAWKIGMN